MKSESRTDSRSGPWYLEGVILLLLSALVLVGIGWLLPIRELVFPQQESPAQTRPNRPPIAVTIHIKAVAGEGAVVDVREYSHDPEGETLRIRSLGSPRFGTIEQIDHYRFRYSAPLRDVKIDTFPYRIQDTSGGENEGWVLVRIATRAQSRPAPQRATTGIRDHSLRQSAELKKPPTETQAEAILATGVKVKSGEPLQTAPAAPKTVPTAPKPDVVAAPEPVPLPESGAISEAAVATPEAVPMSSKELRARITEALDAEDLPQVRSLCKEAMETNPSPSIAKFCHRWWFMFE